MRAEGQKTAPGQDEGEDDLPTLSRPAGRVPEQLAPGSRQRVYVNEHRACGGVRKALFTLTDEEA